MRAHLLPVTALLVAAACSDADDGRVAGSPDALADSAVALDVGADPTVGFDTGAGDTGSPATPADALGAGGRLPDVAAPAPTVYFPGGILGSYTALDEAGAPLWTMQRLDSGLDAPWGSPWLAAVSGGGPFNVTWTGGWLVDAPGEWSLRAIAGGGVIVRVDGAPLVARVVSGAIVVEDGAAPVTAGWHELSVTWTYEPATPVLHLLFTPPDGLPRVLTNVEFGTPEAAPAEPAAVSGIELLSVGPFEARLAVTTSTPSLVELQVAGATGVVVAASPPASWSTRTVLSVALAKGLSWQALATATDLWGRPAGPANAAFETPGDGSWSEGALLGRYYAGMQFEELRMQRLDPGVTMPLQVDDDVGGSFGAPMPPDQFSVRWEGALHIDEAGPWTLWLGADDGQRLTLDGEVLAQNWSDHGTSWVGATRQLAEGWHPIVVEMYENGGAAVARLEWEGPQTPRAPVPPASLGTSPAEDDGVAPIIEELTTEPAGPGRALVRWRATELVSATLQVGDGPSEDLGPVDLGPPSTGGQRVLDGLPAGELTLTLAVVDRFGNAGLPLAAAVLVEETPEPAEGTP